MGHPDIDYQLIQERHREDIAAAERWRLAKQAEAARANSPAATALSEEMAWSFRMRRFLVLFFLALARMLSYIGGWLLNWSCRLQTRFEALNAAEIQRQPKPCT